MKPLYEQSSTKDIESKLKGIYYAIGKSGIALIIKAHK